MFVFIKYVYSFFYIVRYCVWTTYLNLIAYFNFLLIVLLLRSAIYNQFISFIALSLSSSFFSNTVKNPNAYISLYLSQVNISVIVVYILINYSFDLGSYAIVFNHMYLSFLKHRFAPSKEADITFLNKWFSFYWATVISHLLGHLIIYFRFSFHLFLFSLILLLNFLCVVVVSDIKTSNFLLLSSRIRKTSQK